MGTLASHPPRGRKLPRRNPRDRTSRRLAKPTPATMPYHDGYNEAPIADAPDLPPEICKRRVVKTEDVRALLCGTFKEIQSEFMTMQTIAWPAGSFNPPPLSSATNALEMQAHGALNREQAKLEVAARINQRPGLDDVIFGRDHRREG